jgi:branched-chain amino acid transport system ATP-binding protein
MNTTILEARNLRKEFGKLVAVSDISLRVERGTTHAIIGPNGAGKTTFFNLLTGHYRPTSGAVIFNGRDCTTLPSYERARLGMGRSFQITNVFPNLTVLENVRLAAQALGPDNYRMFRRASRFTAYTERAAQALEQVGLIGQAGLPASALPHGGKRKLELAILLAADPELLLLDEPTAGMATEQMPELIETIQRIQRDGHKTIVMVEHNMSVVMGISDRITVMHQGTLLADGTPAAIARNATVQAVYLGDLYGTAEELLRGRGGEADA